MAPPTFIGGKLNLKGDKKKAKKKKSKLSKANLCETSKKQQHLDLEAGYVNANNKKYEEDDDDDLTEAEKRAMHFKLEKEKRDLEKVAKLSHRERIDEFNNKLSELTEHNDIPRVSAAGNG